MLYLLCLFPLEHKQGKEGRKLSLAAFKQRIGRSGTNNCGQRRLLALGSHTQHAYSSTDLTYVLYSTSRVCCGKARVFLFKNPKLRQALFTV
ncbi:uncharacterized protein LOC142767569 isoform X3 [Rhipicephalus microplus]|uniref:uncharacterized protein LOC142767569 isoform X3 n=1 Tax=Rhipicephalus microplus TaxID=6941 RepID=UPI003F6B42DB